MYEYLTVGKLRDILSNVSDEAQITFWKKIDDNNREEITMQEFVTFYSSGNDFRTPMVAFIVEE